MRVFISLLLLLVTAGCRSSLQDIDPKKFSFAVEDVVPHFSLGLPISASVIEADTTLRVRNDNDVRVKLEGVDFELLVNDRRALLGSSTEKIDVPARGDGMLHLHARATGSQLLDIIGLIRDGDARYTVKGIAHYRTFVGVIDIPFQSQVAGNR